MMKPTGHAKEEAHRRRRRRSSEEARGSPSENIGDGCGSSADSGGPAPDLTPSEEHDAASASVTHSTAMLPPVQATASSGDLNSNTSRRHTGKRRASGEMIHHEEETKVMQPATPQGHGNEIRRPDLPERPVVSATTQLCSGNEVEPSPVHNTPEPNIMRTPAAAAPHTPTLPVRASTRRTTTTTRWSPSVAGVREPTSKTGASKAAPRRPRSSVPSGPTVTPPARPISNATRNINFHMLQPHFERPLQQAADSFGVCTTLLKKICRRNGISNWPYRKICGLRKSIASMAKQVNYFDGEQKRAYADQLEKLEFELQAYLRTGNEPTEAFLRLMREEAAAVRTATTNTRQTQADLQTPGPGNEDEEKEARVVPTWTARPSIPSPPYEVMHSPQDMHTAIMQIPTTGMSASAWGDNMHSRPLLQPPAFPTIATHHRALPSIASILQHQSYSSPSRAASTQQPSFDGEQLQQTQWRYFPPTTDDAV